MMQPIRLFLALVALGIPASAAPRSAKEVAPETRNTLVQAQSLWEKKELQPAWEAYSKEAASLVLMTREFPPEFTLWALKRHLELGETEAAEALARALILSFDKDKKTITPEQRALLAYLYAEVALGRGDQARARAHFEAIVNDPAYESLAIRVEAQFRIAEIDRQIGQYDKAISRLERLSQDENVQSRVQALYSLARVKFDQEEYSEASTILDRLFALEADHTQGRILQGRVNLKTNRLIDATEIRAGLAATQALVVPGKSLRISLEDRNLAIARGELLEVRVWTDSGDEEMITLLPVGDSRTVFAGDVQTGLGTPKKGDRRLQLLGSDKVHYDFSPEFKKSGKIGETAPVTMTVASDAELYASAGAFSAVEEDPDEDRGVNSIKPGNHINIRVVDPARNLTPGKDSVTVDVESSGGGKVSSFALRETGDYTGVFEGTIPTRSSPPMAFASSSAEGSSPATLLSARSSAPWIGANDGLKPRAFSVDLKQNAALGTLNFQSEVAGRKLMAFRVETSLNGTDYEEAGAWPVKAETWRGKPIGELVPLPKSVAQIFQRREPTQKQIRQFLEEGWIEAGVLKKTFPLAAPALSMDLKEFGTLQKKLGVKRDPFYLLRIRATVWSGERQTRTFQVLPGAEAAQGIYALMVDGEHFAASRGGAAELKVSLPKGVHVVEIIVIGNRQTPPSVQLMMDDPETSSFTPVPESVFAAPEIAKTIQADEAEITANPEGTAFSVKFPNNARARKVRLVLEDFEGDAPAISKLALSDREGRPLLPNRDESAEGILEISPGDRIRVKYANPAPVTKGKALVEAALAVTFSNAGIKAVYLDSSLAGKERNLNQYQEMRRYSIGSRINVLVFDPDKDTTESRDSLDVEVTTSTGRKSVIKALETAPHSGLFLAALFPVAGVPTKEGEVQVAQEEDITFGYLDQDNTEPGIPWLRTALVEQAVYRDPEMRIYSTKSEPDVAKPSELQFIATRPEKPTSEPVIALLNGPLFAEVKFPFNATSPASEAILYLQTESMRKNVGKEGAFDPTLPGTIKVTAHPEDIHQLPALPEYQQTKVRGLERQGSALDDGRFLFVIPMAPDPAAATGDKASPTLSALGGDTIHVGFRFKNGEGKEQWLTGTVQPKSDSFFKLTDRRHENAVEALRVGETLYFSVSDKSKNVTNERDRIEIIHQKTGARIELMETSSNSGVFTGMRQLVHESEKEIKPTDLPVSYGAELLFRYEGGAAPQTCTVRVFPGSDGSLAVFTRSFKDSELGLQTEFKTAEAYFELAKKHRALGEMEGAHQKIAQGKRILEEAIRDFPAKGQRTEADYLLANLSAEMGDMTDDEKEKRKHYLEGIARFTRIVNGDPESSFAPKAQYKKALIFEKLGEIDQACEEYVRLAYRYPDDALVADTMARLGQYFLTKGKAEQEEAARKTDPVEKKKLEDTAKKTLITAAEVFGRLPVLFPTHSLAAKTQVLSGQCYLRAGDLLKAVQSFSVTSNDVNADKDLRAEAMYWMGDSYLKMEDYSNAYRTFKRLTWDYPESTWAKYSRGKLAEGPMAKMTDE